jgi:hypothetical protein
MSALPHSPKLAERQPSATIGPLSRRRVSQRLLQTARVVLMRGVIAFAALYLSRVLGHDPNPALTYSFAAAAPIGSTV